MSKLILIKMWRISFISTCFTKLLWPSKNSFKATWKNIMQIEFEEAPRKIPQRACDKARKSVAYLRFRLRCDSWFLKIIPMWYFFQAFSEPERMRAPKGRYEQSETRAHKCGQFLKPRDSRAIMHVKRTRNRSSWHSTHSHNRI